MDNTASILLVFLKVAVMTDTTFTVTEQDAMFLDMLSHFIRSWTMTKMPEHNIEFYVVRQ